MCDPISLAAATTAVGSASSVLGFAGQNQAAQANKTAANLAYANTGNQVAVRGAQIDQQQSENTVQAMIDRVTAQGRISASASSMGGDAATTARTENAADFASGRSLSLEDVNSQNQRIGNAQTMTNAFYTRQSQENQVLPGNPLSLALGLAKAGLGGASAFGKLGGQFGGTSPDVGASPTGGADSSALLPG